MISQTGLGLHKADTLSFEYEKRVHKLVIEIQWNNK